MDAEQYRIVEFAARRIEEQLAAGTLTEEGAEAQSRPERGRIGAAEFDALRARFKSEIRAKSKPNGRAQHEHAEACANGPFPPRQEPAGWPNSEPAADAQAETEKAAPAQPIDAATLFVAKEHRIAASQQPNAIVVLYAFKPGKDGPTKVRLTKEWRADGTVSDYDRGALTYRAEVALINSMAEFDALLRFVKSQPDCCIVRGALALNCYPDHVYRRSDAEEHSNAALVDVPRSWFAIDIDGFKGGDFPTCRAMFPPELREAEMLLQYSASHGHATKAGQLRFHAWFFLPTPLGSLELKRWTKSLAWPDEWRNSPKGNVLDLGLSDAARPHYIADPVLEDGVVDPIAERVIHVDGGAIDPPVVPEPNARGPAGRSRGEGGSYEGSGECFEGPFREFMIRDGEQLLANGLVSGRSDYDGLVYAENGQLLWRDEQLDAASDAGLLLDQSELVEGLEHLVD